MEKPKIEVRPVPGFEKMGVKLFINDRNPSIDQIADRYRRIVDALIDMRESSLNDNKGLTEALKKTDQALERAGCELPRVNWIGD